MSSSPYEKFVFIGVGNTAVKLKRRSARGSNPLVLVPFLTNLDETFDQWLEAKNEGNEWDVKCCRLIWLRSWVSTLFQIYLLDANGSKCNMLRVARNADLHLSLVEPMDIFESMDQNYDPEDDARAMCGEALLESLERL